MAGTAGKRIIGWAAAVLALGLFAVVPAWACTTYATLAPPLPQVGEPRSVVALTGNNFSKTVEVHWGSATGPVLATTGGPSLSGLKVTIPADASPGVHYLVAVSRDADGQIVGKATAPFEVGGASELAASPWQSAGERSADRSSSPVGIGIVLASAGTAGLFGAFSVAGLNRRRRAERAG